MDNQKELVALRNKILGDIMPLVLDSEDNGSDRFALLLRVIQAGGADGAVYARAYESAKSIEDADDRLDALLSLLDEIDFDTNQQVQAPESSDVRPPAEEKMDNPANRIDAATSSVPAPIEQQA